MPHQCRACAGLEAQLIEMQQALAEAERARSEECSRARQNLDRAQDANANLFRVCEQLDQTRLDAGASYARCLDLEAQLRARLDLHEADLGEVERQRVNAEGMGARLQQALDMVSTLQRELATERGQARWQQEHERHDI